MLGTHLEGFYYSEYVDKKGTQRRIASTHFEPTYARRAFPCFDEPHLKAQYIYYDYGNTGCGVFKRGVQN